MYTFLWHKFLYNYHTYQPSKAQKLDMKHPVCALYTEKKGGEGEIPLYFNGVKDIFCTLKSPVF